MVLEAFVSTIGQHDPGVTQWGDMLFTAILVIGLGVVLFTAFSRRGPRG